MSENYMPGQISVGAEFDNDGTPETIMSHTQKQASELWCPMVRLAGCLPSGEVSPGQTVVNRLQIDINSGASIPNSANCIAEKCAMWRWTPSDKTELRRKVESFPEGGGREVYVDIPTPPTHGYCGLAGRPEVMR